MPGPMRFDELTVAVTGDRIDRLAFCLMNMRGQLMGRHITARPVVDTVRADPQCRPHLPGTDPEMTSPDGYAATSRRPVCGDDRMRPPLRAAGLPVGKPKGETAQKAPGRQRSTCPPAAAEGRPPCGLRARRAPCHLCTEAAASGGPDRPCRRSDRLRRALRQQRQALRQGPFGAGNDGPVGLPCPTGVRQCGENTPPARPGPDAGSPGRTSPPVWRRSGVLPQALRTLRRDLRLTRREETTSTRQRMYRTFRTGCETPRKRPDPRPCCARRWPMSPSTTIPAPPKSNGRPSTRRDLAGNSPAVTSAPKAPGPYFSENRPPAATDVAGTGSFPNGRPLDDHIDLHFPD